MIPGTEAALFSYCCCNIGPCAIRFHTFGSFVVVILASVTSSIFFAGLLTKSPFIISVTLAKSCVDAALEFAFRLDIILLESALFIKETIILTLI